MPTRFVTIQNKVYQFDYDYKNTDFRREALNRMTKETWGFSFEHWYQNGFWPDSCVPYSLFDLQKMVSHVTATIFTFALEGKTLKALQLGTVMTDPDYRGRGLSRWLIDRVLEDFDQQVDFVFLYANDSVLDFYPKFGFKRAPEFFAAAEWTGKDRIAANKADVRKLDITQQQDQQILMRIASQTTAQYRMTPLQNQSMLFLYSGFSELSFLENSLYYFPEMDAVTIASVKEDTLAVYDILSPKKVPLDYIISSLSDSQTKRAELYFLPEELSGFSVFPLEQKDSTLFVRGTDLFFTKQLCLPVTSHT